MKRLTILLILIFFLILSASASGDPNVDSGGGGMGGGSGSSYWNPGWDGVRVTVVDTSGNQLGSPVDLTNKSVSTATVHCGKHSKLYYKQSLSLSISANNYSYINPVDNLPVIVNWTGGNNIDAIKTYFTDTGHLQEISDYIGISYDNLIGGNYKLLLEPIAYFKYQGIDYAMTATEAALYDVMTSHSLYTAMRSLTHQNLPLAMFLQKTDSDLGLAAWTGATSGFQSNNNIIKYLGAGVISFKDNTVAPDPQSDYTYHTDTDVITAISFTNTYGEISPDNPAWLTFTINGTTYDKEFICPEGGHQIVWVRWHTPSTPQDVIVHASCSQIGLSANITCHVVELTETTPPDPHYEVSGTVPVPDEIPNFGNNTSSTWGEWSATWHANWVWVEDDSGTGSGDWVDEGWWDWNYITYTASLEVDYTLSPASRVKTAYSSSSGFEMKSGYGVSALCKTIVTASDGTSSYDYTQVQNVNAVFPEFNYTTYNRLLEFTLKLHGYYDWEFKVNPASFHGERSHFTPLRFPDEKKYTVPLEVMDSWTPGGQLCATVSSSIVINGNMYSDGYIRVLK
jgi:hypothetical protein